MAGIVPGIGGKSGYRLHQQLPIPRLPQQQKSLIPWPYLLMSLAAFYAVTGWIVCC